MSDLNPHATWMFDGHGKVLDVSEQWERITGCTRESTLGTGYMNSIYADDRQRVERLMLDSIRWKKDIDIQWRVRSPTGQLRWVRSRGKAICDSSGELYRYYGITEDIDELVRLRHYKADKTISYSQHAVPTSRVI